MRFAYLDEAGISNPDQEPFTVVAGVVIHADRQWKAVETYLRDMADEFAPPSKRTNFCFHAKDIFHGAGYFPRNEYPDKEARWRILDELLKIPRKFDMPVVMGMVKRDSLPYPDHYKPVERAVLAQVVAYSACVAVVEHYMREGAEDGEVAMVVVENNDQARRLIRETHNLMRDPSCGQLLPAEGPLRSLLPFNRIVEAPHFAYKTDSSLLQVADACVFAIKRHLMGAKGGDRFYAPLIDNLIAWPKSGQPSSPVAS